MKDMRIELQADETFVHCAIHSIYMNYHVLFQNIKVIANFSFNTVQWKGVRRKRYQFIGVRNAMAILQASKALKAILSVGY